MRDTSQMMKGTLEGCILKVISTSETYGYEISEKLKVNGFPNISEGTIYPLLLRLEKNGFISATYKESPLGPKRKYFKLTEEGEQELTSFWSKWLEIELAVHQLFDEKGEPKK